MCTDTVIDEEGRLEAGLLGCAEAQHVFWTTAIWRAACARQPTKSTATGKAFSSAKCIFNIGSNQQEQMRSTGLKPGNMAVQAEPAHTGDTRENTQ